MRNRTISLTLLFAGIAGCSDNAEISAPLAHAERPSLSVQSSGSNSREWSDLADDSLWAYIVRADSIVDVGLRMPGARKGIDDRGRILVVDERKAFFRRQITNDAGVQLIAADTLLPLITVRLREKAALARLRKQPFVSYVEPGQFVDSAVELWKESGCAKDPYSGPASSTLSPGDVLPWNFVRMEIDKAWTKSTGVGVLIGLVDTGIASSVPELNMPAFANGVPGRSVTSSWTSGSSGNDNCSHGTRMAGVIAAPRNGQLTVGVAYGASLYSVRVDDDVLLTNVAATRLGIRAASDAGARVISMAFGTVMSYSSISDEINWHYNNRDRLFIAAAGTSTGVFSLASLLTITFPGTLSTVTTVTALDASGSVASNAHRGPKVEFAAYASQPAPVMHPFLGPIVGGIGGSSNATAVISGIVGLILQRNPTFTRAQIRSALISAAAPSGYRRNDIGWGVPSALCAIGAMCTAWIDGQTLIESTGSYTFSGRQSSSPGPFAYSWTSGETTQSISRQINITYGTEEYSFEIGVTITDLSDGSQKYVSKPVTVRQPNSQCPTCF